MILPVWDEWFGKTLHDGFYFLHSSLKLPTSFQDVVVYMLLLTNTAMLVPSVTHV